MHRHRNRVYRVHRATLNAACSLKKHNIIKFSESDKTVELVWWPNEKSAMDKEKKNESTIG